MLKLVGEIKRPGGEGPRKVRLGSVGLGGTEIFSETKIKVGERLEVKITILTKKGKNLVGNFPCEVRWAYPYKDGFLAGVQFDQPIDKDNNFGLFSFIVESSDYFGSP